jgi:2-polyprenyl-6-hydroxyphenyl methylase/3-demethylubiquinone-9 3-methyltransferase
MPSFVLTQDENIETVLSYFERVSNNDSDFRYLRLHYLRFLRTRKFALSEIKKGQILTVLDIGSHWLHNAFFYANLGHQLICMNSSMCDHPAVIRMAKEMNVRLQPGGRMEKAEGFVGIEDSSIDLVLFCEIIEHLAFNPINFWKQVYRVLKPGGRIIVTTPNAFYYPSAKIRLEGMLSGKYYGVPVQEIFSRGTYGHHWKEFTLPELKFYFNHLSSDFDTSRFEMVYKSGEENINIDRCLEAIGSHADVRACEIYLDVKLKSKEHGIQIVPPW